MEVKDYKILKSQQLDELEAKVKKMLTNTEDKGRTMYWPLIYLNNDNKTEFVQPMAKYDNFIPKTQVTSVGSIWWTVTVWWTITVAGWGGDE